MVKYNLLCIFVYIINLKIGGIILNVDVVILIIVLAGGGLTGLFFLNRWASTKMSSHQNAIEKAKQPATIYIIDKKKDKITNVTMPKAAIDQVPAYAKVIKHYFVKAKIGPQIITLMCDKEVFNALPLKKNVKVELAGIYIVTMKGMKTKRELKEEKKLEKQAIKLQERLEKEENGKK